ncbi:MAG TPA: peptidylprolyl isomerase [Mycobacteriales bacterium]|nr:peptidylprolyl isomerase [Mycobacteriales bacterium]
MNISVRPLVVMAATLLLGSALAGCNTSPGAAAVVGNDRIPVTTLQQTVDRALKDPAAQQQLGQDRPAFVRNELSRLITNIVVAKAASDEHVTVSNSDIDHELDTLAQQTGGKQQLIQAASASGVPQQDLRNFVRYFVMQQKLGDALAANINVSDADLQAAYQKDIDKYDQVDSAHILVKTKAEADKILAQVRANPSSFAALAAKDSLDTGSKTNGGELGFQGHSQFVKPFADAIFAAKPGTFVEVQSQFGWHVIHVIAHKTTPLSQVAPQLKATILGPQRQALVQKELSAVAKRIGVHVNPRFGVWDPKSAKVVAPSDKGGLSSPAPSSST